MIRRLHYCIPVVALSLGLALGMIEPVGALAVLLFAGWLVAQPHIPNSPWLFGTLLGALLLAAHLLPEAGLPWWVYVMVAPLAMLGTTLGKMVLDRINDGQFKSWSRNILFVLGAILIWQGLELLLTQDF